MKERPILMNGFSIDAILSGEKTQTRRVIKPQPEYDHFDHVGAGFTGLWCGYHLNDPAWEARCPYGKPGDQLWVRESWALLGTVNEHHLHDSVDLNRSFKIRYLSSPGEVFAISLPYTRINELEVVESPGKKPSIFIPREFSRIQLQIEDIRVERLQDITLEEAIAEGCLSRSTFVRLWNDINEDRGYGWEKSPWVWVVEFRKIGLMT